MLVAIVKRFLSGGLQKFSVGFPWQRALVLTLDGNSTKCDLGVDGSGGGTFSEVAVDIFPTTHLNYGPFTN